MREGDSDAIERRRRRRLFPSIGALAQSFEGDGDPAPLLSSPLSRQSKSLSCAPMVVGEEGGGQGTEQFVAGFLSGLNLREQNQGGGCSRPSPPRPDVFEAARSLRDASR